LGRVAGWNITTGSNNLCLGISSGRSTSPSGEITTGSNTICLGNNDIANIYCADTSISSSDSRDKADQTNFTGGLDWVNAMQPITYKWDKRVWYNEDEDPTLKITTSIANTFTSNKEIKGRTSGATAKFASGSGDIITLNWDVDGDFEAGETIYQVGNGTEDPFEPEIEATVAASNFFDDGLKTPADILATTPDGTHKKDSVNLGFTSQSILAIEQANGYALTGNDSSLIVDLTADGTFYGLKYERMVPILVNAIKELSTKNDALEARIATLEG